MKITEAGRALVQSPEFAALINIFMRSWVKAGKPDELAVENVIRFVALSLCEIDPEPGPALDSPELEIFISDNQAAIEAAGAEFVRMLNQTRMIN
jgi:hypothetical protein